MNIFGKYGHSSFWMDRTNDRAILSDLNRRQSTSSYNLYKLSSSKKAISNFVSILTGKNIPVKFHTNGNSMTDSKIVIISANLEDPKEFDVACGLALHEASHILLSDFDIKPNLKTILEDQNKYHSLAARASKVNVNCLSSLALILNYVEDRRIDRYIFDRAPGYRGYYYALYDKYFNSPTIDDVLQSSYHTTETCESYEFRLINLHSKFTQLDALKGLPEIYKTVDLKNIDRLNNSAQALEVAIDVFEIILNHLEEVEMPQQPNPPENDNGEPESGNDDEVTEEGMESNSNQSSNTSTSSDETEDSDGGSEPNSTSDEEESNSSNGKGQGEEPSEENNDEHNSDKSTEKSNEEADKKPSIDKDTQEKTDELIEKQKEFINGETKKVPLSNSEVEQMKEMENSQAEIETVAKDNPYFNAGKGIDVVVIKNFNQRVLDSATFPFKTRATYDDEVEKGIRLGRILGKKLQVRSEQRETVFSRQRKGKIDKRLIHSLGYGSENVFYYKDVDVYNTVNLHFSLDASSSMYGAKWNESLTLATAIATAVDMISNVEVQISIRGTNNGLPLIAIIYDSRKDSFNKVRSLFPQIAPCAYTPEGLTFEAISDELLTSSNNLDSIFLNISDGMPEYSNRRLGIDYSGINAQSHTLAQVKKMKEKGIKVISFFVTRLSPDHKNYTEIRDSFYNSYGKDSKIINVQNMNEVARTINKVLLEK